MKIKDIIIFFGGVGSGLALGYVLTKAKLEAKFNTELNQEVEALHKKYFGEGYELSKEKSENIARAEKEIKGVKSKGKTTDYCSFYTKKGVEIVSSHNNILDPGGPTDGDSTELEDEEACEDSNPCVTNSSSREAFNRGIELITEIEFNDKMCQGMVYDKREIMYYEDDIVTDDEDQILDGYLDLLGSDWIDVLNQGDQNVVFVRNNKVACDYRIEKVGDSFY